MRYDIEKFEIIIFTIMFLFSVSLFCGCLQKKEISENLSAFQPGNKDSLSYDEMKLLMENYTPPPTIPESEMTQIVFSKNWFMQNDEDPRTSDVRLTFPITWLNKSPVSDNEPVILLRVPKRLLEMNDVNADPDIMTVSFQAQRFKEYPNLSAVSPAGIT